MGDIFAVAAHIYVRHLLNVVYCRDAAMKIYTCCVWKSVALGYNCGAEFLAKEGDMHCAQKLGDSRLSRRWAIALGCVDSTHRGYEQITSGIEEKMLHL